MGREYTEIERKFVDFMRNHAESIEELEHYSDYFITALSLAVKKYSQFKNEKHGVSQLIKELNEINQAGLVFGDKKLSLTQSLMTSDAIGFTKKDKAAMAKLVVERYEEMRALIQQNPYYRTLEQEDGITLERHDDKFRFSFMDEETRDEFAEELDETAILIRPLSPHLHFSQRNRSHYDEYFIDISPKEISSKRQFIHFLDADYDFNFQELATFFKARPSPGVDL